MRSLTTLRIDSWSLFTVSAALLLGLPMLTVLTFLLQPWGDVFVHLAATVLPAYVGNSLLLMLGVSAGVLSIGITSAWLTSTCRFPGQAVLSWALLLPMAVPAYIIAYTYTGMLSFEGPVQGQLREWFNWQYGDYWFPEVRSIGGAMIMLSAVLYPYVYMLARTAFLQQSGTVLEVGRSLGHGPWTSFLRVALPLARPAIVAGLSLALMETLADYGTVKYFGVVTFTTGIFRTWFGFGDSAAAARLAALLLGFVFALILLERWSRRHMRFHHAHGGQVQQNRYQLEGWRAALACIACLLPVLAGFLLPAMQLLYWSLDKLEHWQDPHFLQLAWHSLELAGAAALIATALALLLAYGKRLRPTPLLETSVTMAGLGYAIPGTVIAVGVLLPFAWFDNAVDAWLREQFGFSSGLLLSGTLAALLFAYTVRFLSVSLGSVEAGLARIPLSMDHAARSLGQRPMQVLGRIHLPILRGSVLTALLLVFVDVLKELPATLILRPFNFNTLAVRAYEMANDERLADAGPPALMIVAAGVIPVILLSRGINKAAAYGGSP